MSDILIRGMEMPKTAGDCSTKIDPETRRCIYTGKEFEETLSLLLFDRCDDCPLFEVPAHGNLIDRDAEQLKNKLKLIREAEVQIYGGGSWGFASKAQDAIYDAPVIIPAEWGEREKENL